HGPRASRANRKLPNFQVSASSRVGRLDDGADGFLIEAFESAFALQVFQVTAQGALLEKLVELILIDQPELEQPLGAFASHGPAFALGEGLLEEREVGERFHGIDAAAGQLLAQE